MDQYLPDKELVFGVVSGKASRAINRRLYRSFRTNGINLTPEQWMVLQYLSYNDGISQQELARITYKDKPGITRMLRIMERELLISRLSDDSDKRSNKIVITKKGMDMHQSARVFVLQTMQDALNGLSEEEIRIGERILKKIFDNLE